MQNATLCLLVDNSRVLLGMKKRGFGSGKFNGFGGKPKGNESILDTAVRELQEESSVCVSPEDMEKVGELFFYFSKKPEWNQVVHVFLAKKWQGVPIESEEMRPEWFENDKIPFHLMWADDVHWMPLVLSGKKIQAEFTFGGDNETIQSHKIEKF